jgi:hypothetical protein
MKNQNNATQASLLISRFEEYNLPIENINCNSILVRGLKPNGREDKEIKTSIHVNIVSREYDLSTRTGTIKGYVVHEKSIYDVIIDVDLNPEKEVSYVYKITGASKMFKKKKLLAQ